MNYEYQLILQTNFYKQSSIAYQQLQNELFLCLSSLTSWVRFGSVIHTKSFSTSLTVLQRLPVCLGQRPHTPLLYASSSTSSSTKFQDAASSTSGSSIPIKDFPNSSRNHRRHWPDLFSYSECTCRKMAITLYPATFSKLKNITMGQRLYC